MTDDVQLTVGQQQTQT